MKLDIYVNFLSSLGIGTGRVNMTLMMTGLKAGQIMYNKTF